MRFKQKLPVKQPDAQLRRDLVTQLVNYVMLKDGDDIQSLSAPINYVMGKNGAFEVRQTGIGTFAIPLENAPGLAFVDPLPQLKIPKVPYGFFLTAYSFFKRVDAEMHTEAALFIFWDPKEEVFFFYCPEQTVSASSVEYEKDSRLYELARDNHVVIELHSHNSMNAFFSTTDDANEKTTGFYGVFGKLSTEPEFCMRISVGGRFAEVPLGTLFEMPVVSVAPGRTVALDRPIFAETDFPVDWLKRLSKQFYAGYWRQGWYDVYCAEPAVVSSAPESMCAILEEAIDEVPGASDILLPGWEDDMATIYCYSNRLADRVREINQWIANKGLHAKAWSTKEGAMIDVYSIMKAQATEFVSYLMEVAGVARRKASVV